MSESSRRTAPVRTIEHSDRVILRSRPKIIFLYPSCLLALLAGVIVNRLPEHAGSVGIAFLAVLLFNLLVLTVDFPRSS